MTHPGELLECQRDILDEIAHVQAKRRKNWRYPDGPVDEALEKTHSNKIAALKREFAQLENAWIK